MKTLHAGNSAVGPTQGRNDLPASPILWINWSPSPGILGALELGTCWRGPGAGVRPHHQSRGRDAGGAGGVGASTPSSCLHGLVSQATSGDVASLLTPAQLDKVPCQPGVPFWKSLARPGFNRLIRPVRKAGKPEGTAFSG